MIKTMIRMILLVMIIIINIFSQLIISAAHSLLVQSLARTFLSLQVIILIIIYVIIMLTIF